MHPMAGKQFLGLVFVNVHLVLPVIVSASRHAAALQSSETEKPPNGPSMGAASRRACERHPRQREMPLAMRELIRSFGMPGECGSGGLPQQHLAG
jgi:hypothetical protein